jgi:diguanylate cyclase (GGDEF)-like protein
MVKLRHARRALGASTVLRGSEPVGDLPSSRPDEFKQRLRMRRFLLASLFSVLYLLVLAIFSTQNKVDQETLIVACGIVAALILAFSVAFRSGFNLRFSDPSLTGWQLVAAVCTMLFVVYRSPETRLAFTAFFFVALMFGMLRLSGRRLAQWGGISIISFALIIWLRYANNGDVEMLRLDALLCTVMAVTFPWFVYVGERVKRVERRLIDARIERDNIEETSWRDELTGLYNRRAVNVALDHAIHNADATGEPLSLCVIDLDHFKRFNNELGHLEGDAVLRAFAHAVQAALRTTDVFGRYGGEEFVHILRHADLTGAMREAERVRALIGELELPVSRPIGSLTVSIGVAQYQAGEKAMQTFARADEALGRAKLGGRNRVGI